MNFFKLLLIQLNALFITLFCLLFILLPTTIMMIPFKLKIRLKVYAPTWSFVAKIILKYVCHCKLIIFKDLRSKDYKVVPCQGLYIANHQSFMDIPLILTAHQAPPIMKKELTHIPVFGQLAILAGSLPVSRSNSESRKKVFEQAKKRILQEKLGLQFYPEGTRSKDGYPKPLDEIRKSLLYFAYEENIPVIPTSLFGTKGVLNKYGLIHPNKKLGMIVHHEIYPKNFKNVEAFIEECWGQVIRGFNELQPSCAKTKN